MKLYGLKLINEKKIGWILIRMQRKPKLKTGNLKKYWKPNITSLYVLIHPRVTFSPLAIVLESKHSW